MGRSLCHAWDVALCYGRGRWRRRGTSLARADACTWWDVVGAPEVAPSGRVRRRGERSEALLEPSRPLVGAAPVGGQVWTHECVGGER